MKIAKRILAVALALVLVFGNISVLAQAATTDIVTVNFEYYRQNSDGEWVKTTKIARGDTVKARLYVDTTFQHSGFFMMFAYPKGFMTHEYTHLEQNPNNAQVYFLPMNNDNLAVSENSYQLNVVNESALLKEALTDDGGGEYEPYLTESFFTENGWMNSAPEAGSSPFKLNADDWIAEYQFKVADNATGKGYVFIPKESIMAPGDQEAAVTYIFKKEDGKSTGSMNEAFTWNVDVDEDSKLTLDNTVTFNAGSGMLSDGTTTKTVTGYIKDTVTDVPSVTPPTGMEFKGWVPSTVADPTADDVVDASAIAYDYDAVTYNAYYESATGTPYTVNTYTMGVNGTYGEPVTETRYGATGAEVDATPADVAEGFTLNAEKAAERTGTIAADGSLVLNVYIDRNSYTLTTNIDGTETTADYLYGAKVTVDEPTKTGYTFAGWQKDGTTETVDFTDYTMPAENVKVNATWAAATDTVYTVNTFIMDAEGNYGAPVTDYLQGTTGAYVDVTPATVADGFAFNATSSNATGTIAADGSLVLNVYIDRISYKLTTNVDGVKTEVASYLYGATVTAPANPTKTGYTFTGWTPEVPDTMPAQDVELVAAWTINKHTITFYKDTEKTIVIKSETLEYGKVPSYPADPVMPGQIFLGWEDSENSYGITSMPDKDVEVWAVYEPRLYNVTFVNEDGTSFEDGTWDRNDYVYNDEILAENVPDVPSKTGYTPIGWSIDGVNAVTFPVTVTSNIEFKPVYEIKSFNAVFNPDGGEFDDGQTASKTVSVKYGAAINAPTAPTKAGYNFNGWLSQEGKAPSEYTGMPAKALQFTAQWAAATNTPYTVNTYTMGVDGNYGDPVTETRYGTTGADVDVTPATVADGFTFNATSSNVTGTIAADGSLVLNVYIDRNSHNVTFNVNDAEFKTVSVLYGAAVTAPDYTVPEGHSFTGWTVPDTMPNEDITLNATLTANTYNAIFYLDEAKTNEYTRVPTVYGEEIQFPVDPEVAGMTFDGWDNDATVMGAGDMEFVAILTAIEYYIEFVNEDGTPYDDGSYDNIYYYNDSVDAPDVEPTKTGYTFDGWYVNDVKATFPVTVDTDITFEARFVPATGTAYTVNTYTMGVDGTYGTPVTETLYGTTGDDVDATPADVAEGFTYNAGKSTATGTIAADGSLVLNVYIDRNSYTFKTVVDGVENPITYLYGAAVATPEDPTKTGYSFDGWDAEIPATMPASDVTVTAKWTVNQYTITFADTGDSVIAPITQDYGTAITAPENPTKTGYTFDGWDTEIPATMPAGDMTITAKWTINQYTITFDTDGGSEVAPITQDYGTAITAPENPTKTGYTFDGWYIDDNKVDVPATMPAENITLTAKWTEATDTKYVVETYTMKANGAYEKVSVDYTGKTNDPVDVTPATVAEGFTYNAAKSTATGTIAADGSLVLKVFIDRNSYKFTVNVDGTKTETTYRYGEDVVTPDDPEKTGYDFAGWSPEVPATMPAADTEVVAQWTPASGTQYKVNTYMMNTDGSGYAMNSETFTGTTDEVINYTAPAVTGFTYNAEKSTATGKVAADGSLVLRIFYDRNKVNVTIDDVTNDYYYGSTIDDPGDPEAPAGYEFTGWIDGDNNPVTFPFVVPAEDVVITPVYAPLSYTVTFIADGKTVASGSFEFGSAISTPSYTAPTGYTFKGWSTDGSTVLDDLGTVPVDGATFYAVLEANSYSLTFKVDGTVVKGPDSVVYGSAIVTPDDPTPPEGKYFAGWVDETAGTVVPATMPAHDAVYVAKWIENDQAEYTIETYSMNTSGVYELTASVKSEDSVGKIKTAVSSTIPGFTFDAANSVMSGAIKADGSLVLKVYYARNIYTVTFDGGEPINVYFGAVIPAEDPAPQTGKNFTGWTPEIPAAMPAENLAFTSTWTDAEYTITYVVNGVETVETYTYGATVTAPADPVISGMTFKGWSREIPATMPAENLIIVAQFDVAVFKVTFLDDDVNGAVLDEKLVRVGDEIPVTDKIPTKEYYTFTGWTDANGDPLPNVMPAQNIVAVPVFERVPVQLIARDGSTTVIDRKGGTVNDYTADSEWYVYGLEEYLTEEALLNRFVDVQGDGRIEVIPVDVNFGPYRGTGTIINVYDRMGSVDNTADDVLVESFRVVIFGDLNGDAIIRSVDSTIVDDEVYGFTSWSQTVDETNAPNADYCGYMVMAADLDKNGSIRSTDATNIRCYVSGVAEIDQVTGTIKR